MDKNKVFIVIGLAIAVMSGVILSNYLPFKLQNADKTKTELPAASDASYAAENSYSVVYLATGEVYIGKLSFSPKMKLDVSYLLQVVKDAKDSSKSSFQLTPLAEAVWSPKELYLNPDQVIFYGPLKDDSKVAEAIRNANSK